MDVSISISSGQASSKSRAIRTEAACDCPSAGSFDLDDFLSRYRQTAIVDPAHERLDQERLFRELVARHQSRLYRFVTKYVDHPDDAADIAQQAFVEAARTIANFRGDSKLSTWLFGIAMNMVRNYLSRSPHRIYKFETEDSLVDLLSADADPSDQAGQKEMLKLVLGALTELPTEMSEVLTMVALNEVSYQEAAAALSIPLGTVRSRVSRARTVLREQLEKAHVSLAF